MNPYKDPTVIGQFSHLLGTQSDAPADLPRCLNGTADRAGRFVFLIPSAEGQSGRGFHGGILFEVNAVGALGERQEEPLLPSGRVLTNIWR